VKFTPIGVDRLPVTLADRLIQAHHGSRPLRVALDGPRCARLDELAEAVRVQLTGVGRPVGVVAADWFYRDASLRLEYGRQDVEAFYSGWLDRAALQREVLRPVLEDGRYLPSLRDPVSNRATRTDPIALPGNGLLLLVGELLLGSELEFDVTIHASVSRQARRRQTEADWPEWAWTLPAFDRYDIDVDPAAIADLVLRRDDPKHPALGTS
jgi:hypothetical protein